MPSRRRLRLFGISFRRQAIVWSVLLSYCATIFGVPLPATPLKDTSTPFPCQHRACGCLNAAQCWKSCCCFPLQDRVAWAREHHVEPPTQVVVPVAEPSKQEQDEDGDACCREANGTSPTQPNPAAKKPACHHSSSPKSQDKNPPSTNDKSTVWVLGMMARKCGGDAAEWSNVPLALPSAAVFVTWAFDWLLVGWSSSMHISLDGIPTPPSVPPPR